MPGLAVAARTISSVMGGYLLAGGLTAMLGIGLVRAGVQPSEAAASVTLVVFLLYLGLMIWGFAARRLLPVVLVLGIGGPLATMTARALAMGLS